jgi:hypothetical protein
VKVYAAIAFVITACAVSVAAHNAYTTTPAVNQRIHDDAHMIARRIHELYSWYGDALPVEYRRLEQHELAAVLLEKYSSPAELQRFAAKLDQSRAKLPPRELPRYIAYSENPATGQYMAWNGSVWIGVAKPTMANVAEAGMTSRVIRAGNNLPPPNRYDLQTEAERLYFGAVNRLEPEIGEFQRSPRSTAIRAGAQAGFWTAGILAMSALIIRFAVTPFCRTVWRFVMARLNDIGRALQGKYEPPSN